MVIDFYRRTYRLFFFSSRRRHTRFDCDWSSDVCSSDLRVPGLGRSQPAGDFWMERGRVYDLVDGDRDAAVQSGHRRGGNYGLAELYPHKRYLADRLRCAVAGKRPDSHAAILRGDARGQGDHPAIDSAWRGG